MTNMLKVEGVEIPKLPAKTGKVNKRYEEGLKQVYNDLLSIKKRQEEAHVNIQDYKKELAQTGVDVAIVRDDIKRREVLDRRETLRGLIEEEELYIGLDYQAYKQRLIEESNLDELRFDAGREYREINLAVAKYKEHVRKEAELSINAADAMAEKDNDYLKLLADHKRLTGKDYSRWEAAQQK